MKKTVFLVIELLNVFILSAQLSQKKALFVIVDGIPADVIEKLATPTLDTIAKAGAYLHAYVGGEKGTYSETPTISAVGYNSLLTGTWVNKHNVWDNDIKAPNYHYRNIFRLLKEQQPSQKTAIFSSWIDNRTKLIAEGLPEAGSILLDHHFDGLELDTVKFPHDEKNDYMHLIDEEVVNHAAAYIRNEAPDLSWVYLEYTDDMGHMYGDSEQFYKAVEMMDDQMRRLWEAIRYRQKNFGEDWVIYITTDHGRDAKTGKNHGGQSDRERNTWIVTNAKNLNPYFRQHRPGIVDIMPSIASHLGITIPRDELMEIDGISLTGKLSATDPKASYEKGKIQVKWKALEKTGKVKIWVATSNKFKSGRKDDYKLMTELALSKETAVIDVSKMASSFYKLVIEAPHNFLNRWIMVNPGKASK